MIFRTLVFYLLTFLFTFVLGGIQQGTGLNPEIGIPQWGPGLGALAMLVVFRKDAFKLNLSIQGLFNRWSLVALLPLLVAVVVFLFLNLLGIDLGSSFSAISWVMIVWMPFGAFGEELGWRGYLQRKLDQGLKPLLSITLVGVLWAPWHVHLLQNGPVYIFFFILLTIAYSTVLYFLARQTDFNVWVAALFHLMINVSNLVFFEILQETEFMVVNALVWLAVAVGLVFLRRRIYFRSEDMMH